VELLAEDAEFVTEIIRRLLRDLIESERDGGMRLKVANVENLVDARWPQVGPVLRRMQAVIPVAEVHLHRCPADYLCRLDMLSRDVAKLLEHADKHKSELAAEVAARGASQACRSSPLNQIASTLHWQCQFLLGMFEGSKKTMSPLMRQRWDFENDYREDRDLEHDEGNHARLRKKDAMIAAYKAAHPDDNQVTIKSFQNARSCAKKFGLGK